MPRTYYLFTHGRLRRSQNTLFFDKGEDVRTPDDSPDDTGLPSGVLTGSKHVLPIETVSALYLFGEIDLNSKVISFLGKHHVPAFFFDYYGHYAASLQPREAVVSGRLKVAQVRHYLRKEKRLALARAFIEAAFFNLRRNLLYFQGRVSEREPLQDALAVLEAERQTLSDVSTVEQLMGAEGRARHAYYGAWPALLGPEVSQRFPFEKRSRRPPNNALNAMISFGNSLCYAVCLKAIFRTALDPSIAYLHEPGDRRFSLSLDLAEVFKPLLVDRLILRVLKTGQIKPEHFEPYMNGVFLKDTGRRIFVEAWEERLQKTIKHRTLNRSVSYEHLVRLEAFKLIRHLTDKNDPYAGFHAWW